jgi:hypothetical protein
MAPFANGLSLRSSLVAIDNARNIRFASDFLSKAIERHGNIAIIVKLIIVHRCHEHCIEFIIAFIDIHCNSSSFIIIHRRHDRRSEIREFLIIDEHRHRREKFLEDY